MSPPSNARVHLVRLWLARFTNVSTDGSREDRLCSGFGGFGSLGRTRRRLSQEPLFEFRSRQGGREIEALALVAAHPAQEIDAGDILDAFGDHGQAEEIGERDGTDDDRGIVRARPQLVHEGLADLHPVYGKLFSLG